MTCGIYLLTFSSGKKYVGQSINIEERWKQHFDKFQKGTAAEKMQKEFDRYGYPNTQILKICHKDFLDIIENALINSYSQDISLNTTVLENPLAKYARVDIEKVLALCSYSACDLAIALVNCQEACAESIEKDDLINNAQYFEALYHQEVLKNKKKPWYHWFL